MNTPKAALQRADYIVDLLEPLDQVRARISQARQKTTSEDQFAVNRRFHCHCTRVPAGFSHFLNNDRGQGLTNLYPKYTSVIFFNWCGRFGGGDFAETQLAVANGIEDDAPMPGIKIGGRQTCGVQPVWAQTLLQALAGFNVVRVEYFVFGSEQLSSIDPLNGLHSREIFTWVYRKESVTYREMVQITQVIREFAKRHFLIHLQFRK
ncbi:hypothetical protein [Microbulbifer celer]|uniref:Uncharacterized protein n=1 Tax=Microbulbifer celer TaxID=435905 RepID=A0ABW3U6B9_9GAMM|nr:hypothetical protein [Microbulbifer celer]UFN58435.1 hypothetical protein LPW13_05170 [Microbulbifer celer]